MLTSCQKIPIFTKVIKQDIPKPILLSTYLMPGKERKKQQAVNTPCEHSRYAVLDLWSSTYFISKLLQKIWSKLLYYLWYLLLACVAVIHEIFLIHWCSRNSVFNKKPYMLGEKTGKFWKAYLPTVAQRVFYKTQFSRIGLILHCIGSLTVREVWNTMYYIKCFLWMSETPFPVGIFTL